MASSTYGREAPFGNPFPDSSATSSESSNHADHSEPAEPAPPPVRLSIEERIRRRQEQEAAATAAASANDMESLHPELRAGPESLAGPEMASSSKWRTPDSDFDDRYETTVQPSVSYEDRQQIVAAFKAQKRYKPHTVAMVDQFVLCYDDPFTHDLMLYSAVMDLVNNNSQVEVYRIPAGLKSNLRKYTIGVMLSPVLTAYRGNIVSAVMSTIRELGISNIPDQKDEDQNNVVAAEIGGLAIEVRNIIKKQIAESVKPAKKAECHISDLTHNILKATVTELKMTTPMQKRIAFLASRTVFQENTTDYWLKVDQKLRQWEQEHPTSALLKQQMKLNLDIDEEDFPRPKGKLVVHPTIATKDLEKWQLTCDHHAGKAGTEKLARKGKGRGKDS